MSEEAAAPALEPAATPAEKAQAAPRARDEATRTALFLLKLLVLVLAIRSFVVAPFVIPSESMLPRLWVGDYLLVAKWPYGYSRHSLPFSPPLPGGRMFEALPDRGDVVVFKAPPAADHDVVKRVIGLPGDTVQLREGQLILNGVAVPRQRIADFVAPMTDNSPCLTSRYDPTDWADTLADGTRVCRYPRYRETLPSGLSYAVLDLAQVTIDDTPLYRVPAGHLFVLGDNRDRSGDSRSSPADEGVGAVPLDNVEGRVLVTFFSVDGSARLWNPASWFGAIRWDRIGMRS